MNTGRTVFSQLVEFLPHQQFQKCVDRYGGGRYLKNLSCWDQYLAMAFAQLTYRESLRDIEACLGSIGSKLYHMGFRGKIARSTLADANEARDWRIYADFAQVLIAIARPLYALDPIGVGSESICVGLYDHQIVPRSISVGEVSQTQSRRQDAHLVGPAWQYERPSTAVGILELALDDTWLGIITNVPNDADLHTCHCVGRLSKWVFEPSEIEIAFADEIRRSSGRAHHLRDAFPGFLVFHDGGRNYKHRDMQFL
jgi:uncharacterized protein DUF4372